MGGALFAALRPGGAKTAGEILAQQLPASADVLAASLPPLPDAALAVGDNVDEVTAAPAGGAGEGVASRDGAPSTGDGGAQG